MLKKIALFAAILLLPAAALAAVDPVETPHWSLEVKGGYFYPDLNNWKTYYGDDKTWHFAGSLAYKLFRQVDIGVEGGMIRDRGVGYAPLNSAWKGVPVYGGRVTYELYPLNVFVLFRGIFDEDQWLVPYAGGGWTRMFYREKIEAQSSARGFADGYHGRAGLQFLLDNVDPGAANTFALEYGVIHTYFFLEAEYVRAMADSADNTVTYNLGGTSYLAGFLFEF